MSSSEDDSPSGADSGSPSSNSPSSDSSPPSPSSKTSSSPSASPPSSKPSPPANDNNGGNNNNNDNGGNNNNNNDNAGNNNNNNNSGGNNNNNNSGGNNDNNINGNGNNGNNNNNNNNNANNNRPDIPSERPPETRVPTADNSPIPPANHIAALSPPHKSPSRSSGSAGGGNDGNGEKAIIAGVVAGVGLMFIIMIICLVCCCKKKKKRNPHEYYRGNTKNKNDYYNYNNDHRMKMPPGGANSTDHGGWGAPPPPPPMANSADMSSANFSGPYQPAMPPPHPGLALGFNQSTFSYDDLSTATGGFAKDNLLGQGGFGYVHKGVLPNGKEVAVKSLKSGSGQGEREFHAEVDIISRVHHRHLVSLVGYCITGSSRMLVYEFVANDTLESHLHEKGNPVMDWSLRLRIALGAAKGFAYLHEDCHPRIIHRDIKGSNILLDDHFEAKVADFGLAKLSNDTNTHVSTRIMGTFGYLAPEYASSGKLTEKSDVYSYGIVLLELITGRRPVDYSSDDEDTLIDWARPILMRASEGGSYEELVDPRLEQNYNPAEMLRMVASAAACIRHSARRRPKMSQIVRALEGDVSLEDLNEGGVKPGQSTAFGSGGNSEYDGQAYNADIKKFRQIAFASTEFSSGEQGATSEYVHSSSGESQEMRPRRNP